MSGVERNPCGPAAPAKPGAQMLTSEQLADCCGGCRSNSAIETWMQRAIVKFCEVNGIALAEGSSADPVHAATAGAPALSEGQRQALKNVCDHLACLVAIVEDAKRCEGERRYQPGALELQAGFAREWLGSLEAQEVRKLANAGASTSAAAPGGAAPAAPRERAVPVRMRFGKRGPTPPPGEGGNET